MYAFVEESHVHNMFFPVIAGIFFFLPAQTLHSVFETKALFFPGINIQFKGPTAFVLNKVHRNSQFFSTGKIFYLGFYFQRKCWI